MTHTHANVTTSTHVNDDAEPGGTSSSMAEPALGGLTTRTNQYVSGHRVAGARVDEPLDSLIHHLWVFLTKLTT